MVPNLSKSVVIFASVASRNYRFHVSAMKHLRRCALALLVALPMCLAHIEDVLSPHPDVLVSKYVNNIGTLDNQIELVFISIFLKIL